MLLVFLELTFKHDNIRLGGPSAAVIWLLSQARTRMASPNELHSNTDLC